MVAAPAIAIGTPYNAKRLVIVTSTAPIGKPAVIVSTIVITEYMVAKSMNEMRVKLSE